MTPIPIPRFTPARCKKLVALACLAVPIRLFALCFEPPRPCSWYAVHHGKPKFVGTVISDEKVPDVLDVGGQTIHVIVQKVSVRVEEVFEDMPDATAVIYGEGTTNDFVFHPGEKYLIYAWREKDGKLRTTRCTRTSLLGEAAEDIRFLRSLPSQAGGEIFGSVSTVSSDGRESTISGTIEVSGMDGLHKARLSSSGSYDVAGLLPGDYRQSFLPDGEHTEYVTSKVSIPTKGSCAETGVRLGHLTLHGKVLSNAGKPAPLANVFLYYALDGQYHVDTFLKTRTDASGRFTFLHLEPGKFILAVQTSKSAMTFFPGVRDPAKADVLDLQDGSTRADFVIRTTNAP